MKKTKQLTIKNFALTIIVDWENCSTKQFIAWSECEKVMGKRVYKKFVKWMSGQTCYEDGIYPHDLKNFLRYDYLGKKLPLALWD